MFSLTRSMRLCRVSVRSFSATATKDAAYTKEVEKVLKSLGLASENNGVYHGTWADPLASYNTQYDPSTGEVLGKVKFGNERNYDDAVAAMEAAKPAWANTPAPVRGEVVRKIGEKLREYKEPLGKIVSLEMGKIYAEGLGEVQEAIDICDFAVGLSRSLNGSVIPSERPGHLMLERYNPLKGHVGIISAFNFPVAVYFWNLALSLVCGNTNLWKPHENLALTSVAVTKLVSSVLEEAGVSGAVASMVCAPGKTVGEKMINDPRMELVSFTGSTAVGRHVGQAVASRFGKHILELGGNGAMIVDESADVDLAVRATLFGSVGTCGQRCTSQRRVLLHEKIYDEFMAKLLPAYKSVKIGSPLDPKTLCGPLHTKQAVELFKKTIDEAKQHGGKVLVGGDILEGPGNFVSPAVVAVEKSHPLIMEERFIPVLYAVRVGSYEEAVQINNSVPQGLSSALFSRNIEQIFHWSGPSGSDCGIVNTNIGTSGAEIGGAFGGEKETGGGRESGSDAWKQYCRRSTCTINHSKELPLAQGINFGN